MAIDVYLQIDGIKGESAARTERHQVFASQLFWQACVTGQHHA
jgi:type VI protein secretion system component Hcp